MNGSCSARAHTIMLILWAIKDFVFIFFKHIAHGSWFVNRQEINRLELFWLELLELLETRDIMADSTVSTSSDNSSDNSSLENATAF